MESDTVLKQVDQRSRVPLTKEDQGNGACSAWRRERFEEILATFQYLKGPCKRGGDQDKARGTILIKEGRFKLDVMRKLFTQRVMRC